MGRGRRMVVVGVLVTSVLPAATASAAPTRITGLTVEHRTNPVGVDAEKPRLGWQLRSAVQGQRQTAYQVLVASSARRLQRGRADVWNSGKVRSSDSVAVRYAGRELQPSTRYFWTVRIWDKDGRRVRSSPRGFFETALLSTDGKAGWDGARWISMAGKAPNTPGAPILRRQAALAGAKVRSARLYISALGVYDAYVNGQRVTVPQGKSRAPELLTPGWTNYDDTVNFMTYDVTGLVGRERAVTLGAVLGNGWYNSRVSAGSTYYSAEGHPLALKAKLLIRFADGSSQVVVTRPGDGWKATDTGPYRLDDIYDGQAYDARRELPGWAANGFDDSSWSDVVEDDFAARFPGSKLVAYPGETARFMDRWDRRPQAITVATGVTGEGKGRLAVDEARSVHDPAQAPAAPVTIRSGETAIYDLGQNLVGVPRYTVTGPPGATVVVRTGEMLNDASAGADGPQGSVYRANLRSAKATSTYILRGDPQGETHQDSLSFYGFRYLSVEVTTPDTAVTISGVTGKVATSATRDIGNVTTDDPLINQLFSNVRWGQRGNYLWIPTDCPQRDERLGWAGDTQVFANTGLYNADATNFLSHYEDTLISSQRIYGTGRAQFTATAPGSMGNTPYLGLSGWADAGVIVPWTVWQMSGDRTIVDRSWPAMTRYLAWMRARTGPAYQGPGAVFGDWLAFQYTADQLMSDIYYAYSARLMAEMARGTGREAEARSYDALFRNIRKAIVRTYLVTDPITGRVTLKSGLGLHAGGPVLGLLGGTVDTQLPEDDSQTALLWALKLGLHDTAEQRDQLLDHLAQNIGNDADHRAANPLSARRSYAANTLSVGFLGANVLAPVLTDNGRADLAYTLLHQDEMPSWLYSVKNGATTIWERWNSYSKEDGFGPVGMNSFNHYSYGAIAEWMYEDMAGIAKDPSAPGFRHFFLQPKVDPTGKITHVSASHVSPYGRITSEWLRRGGTLTYQATVPANSTATLRLPAASAGDVRLARKPLSRAPGVTFLGLEDGVASFELESGSYRVTTTTR